jgi:hypothetical protein
MMRHAGADGYIDAKKEAFWNELKAIYSNGSNLDSRLCELNEKGVIHYEEIGEDGFAPIVIAGIKDQTHAHFSSLMSTIEAETSELEKNLKEILTFDPEQMTADIEKAQRQLVEARMAATANEMLKPILKPIGEIERHFASVVEVSKAYNNVYKNIIRPVQREGQEGVKATVRWAIISIVVSTMFSVAISNWSKLSELPASPNNTLHTTHPPPVSTAAERQH